MELSLNRQGNGLEKRPDVYLETCSSNIKYIPGLLFAYILNKNGNVYAASRGKQETVDHH